MSRAPERQCPRRAAAQAPPHDVPPTTRRCRPRLCHGPTAARPRGPQGHQSSGQHVSQPRVVRTAGVRSHEPDVSDFLLLTSPACSARGPRGRPMDAAPPSTADLGQAELAIWIAEQQHQDLPLLLGANYKNSSDRAELLVIIRRILFSSRRAPERASTSSAAPPAHGRRAGQTEPTNGPRPSTRPRFCSRINPKSTMVPGSTMPSWISWHELGVLRGAAAGPAPRRVWRCSRSSACWCLSTPSSSPR